MRIDSEIRNRTFNMQILPRYEKEKFSKSFFMTMFVLKVIKKMKKHLLILLV